MERLKAWLHAILPAQQSSRPSESSRVGLVGSRLRPCPSSPNCVSSQALASYQYVPPLNVAKESLAKEVMQALRDQLLSLARIQIILEQSHYIHAEAKTRLGFIDDIELFFDEVHYVVHYRSVARRGFWDFGVNRRRYLRLRNRLRDNVPLFRG